MTATTEAPKMFLHGKGGIQGFYGRVVFQGRTEYVRKHGQWNFNTREQAAAATKRHAKNWAEYEAEKMAAV